jgi:hypothetical protein
MAQLLPGRKKMLTHGIIVAQACSLAWDERERQREEGGRREDGVIDGRGEKNDLPFYFFGGMLIIFTLIISLSFGSFTFHSSS